MKSTIAKLAAVPLALSIGLAANLHAILIEPPKQWDVALLPADAAPTPIPNERILASPVPQEFVESRLRPVFTSSRRPPPPPEVLAPPPPPPPPINITLAGTIVAPDTRIALVKTPGMTALQRLREGQSIAGWTVANVLKDRIVLHAGTIDQEIRLPAPSQADGSPGGNGTVAGPLRRGPNR